MGLLYGFISGVIQDLAHGMLLDRLRKRAEQATDPPLWTAPPNHESEHDLLVRIADGIQQQTAATRAMGKGNNPIEFTVGLNREPYAVAINRQGRKHLALMPGSASVVLLLNTPAGRVTRTITAGTWVELDAPHGTTFALDSTNTNPTETISIRLYN